MCLSMSSDQIQLSEYATQSQKHINKVEENSPPLLCQSDIYMSIRINMHRPVISNVI